MKLDLQLLENIFNIDSPTGFTKNVIDYLDTEIKNLGYSTERNKKGNLIVSVKGESDYTLGLSAHVDTLGLMVRSVMSNGHLRFTMLGGLLLPTLDGEYCKVYTRDGKVYTGTILSTSPSVHVFKDSRSKTRDEDNMYIRLDENVKSKKDTLDLGINNGDIVAVEPKFIFTESGFVKTRFLDDKASVFILVTYLQRLKEQGKVPACNLKIMFTTYEEVGHGASQVPYLDELLAVDMGCIGTDLSCTEDQVSICAKDASGPYDYEMTSKLIELAKKENINYAVDIYPFYSSDATAALRGGADIKAALIGPGIHASHGMERTHVEGIINTIKLIESYVDNINK
ncbi:MAG: M42 family metallopeptidase [Bacilli bacterium]|nr:M42 family metallopeptidase [Bacilli bacterium]